LKTLEGHTAAIRSVNFDRKGLLASGSYDKTVRLWEVSTGNCLKTLLGHTSYVNSVNFDTKGLLASGSGDRSIRLWEVSTGNCLKKLEGHTSYVNCILSGLLAFILTERDY